MEVLDTVRLCRDLERLRIQVLGLNAELTQVVLLPTHEEISAELSVFEGRLRNCLEELLFLKDDFFQDRFQSIDSVASGKGAVLSEDDSNHLTGLPPEPSQVIEYEDLWREFLGLYASCLGMAAKISERTGDEDCAIQLYDRIVLLCCSFGAYTNLDNRGRADGRDIAISRYRVRKAYLLFSQFHWKEAKELVTEAIRDFFSASVDPADRDFETALHIQRAMAPKAVV